MVGLVLSGVGLWMISSPGGPSFAAPTPTRSTDQGAPPAGISVLANLGVGNSPQDWGLSVLNASVYITNSATSGGGNNMTMINGTTNTVTVKNIPLANEPIGVVMNPVNDQVYVAEYNGPALAALNGKTGAPISGSPFSLSSHSCTNPSQLMLMPSTNLLFIGCRGGSNVVVYNVSTTTPTYSTSFSFNGGTSAPYGIVFVPTTSNKTGYICVSSIGGNAIQEFAITPTSTPTISYHASITNFASGSSNIKGLAYVAATHTLYAASQSNNMVSVINPFLSSSQVVRNIPVGSSPNQLTYDSANGYLYVGNGGTNNVTVINAVTNTTVLASIGVGTAPESLGYDPSNNDVYVVNQNSNNVTVLSGGPPPKYPVTFRETGLAPGTAWSASVGSIFGSTNSSTTSTMVFYLPNGTYTYTLGAVSGYFVTSSGQFTVAGASLGVGISFARAWAVTFTESGLPSGTSWTVTLNGTPGAKSSTTTTIAFNVLNATYSWTITPIAGFTTTWSGTVPVNGANVGVPVTFNFYTFASTFDETGLPTGARWYVNFTAGPSGFTLPSNAAALAGSTIPFTLANGTYTYSASTNTRPYHTGTLTIASTVSITSPSVSIPFSTISIVAPGIPVGGGPQSFYFTSWSATNNSVYITNSGNVGTGNNMTVINGTTNSVALKSVALSGANQPVGVLVDPVNQEIYVAQYSADTLTVLNATSNAFITTIALSGWCSSAPSQLLLQPFSNLLYVGCRGGSSVGVYYTLGSAANTLDTSVGSGSGQITTVGNPYGLLFVPTRGPYGYLFVSGIASASGITQINATTNTVVQTITNAAWTAAMKGMAYVPSTNTVYATNQGPGLLAAINATTGAVLAEIPVGSSPNQVAYDSANGNLYVADDGSNNVTVISAATNKAVVPSIGVGTGPTAIGYNPLNSEVYVVNDNSNNVTVLSGGTLPKYTVTLTETGLPSGTTWSATLIATSGMLTASLRATAPGALRFSLPNGTYAVAITNLPSWHQTSLPYLGTVVVVNGASVTGPSVAFTPVVYPLTFTETGLSAGVGWSVSVGGVIYGGTTATLALSSQNGSIPYTVGVVQGMAASPSSGRVTVNGASAGVSISFGTYLYTLTFSAVGFAASTSWAVTVAGTVERSTASTIAFTEPAGVYAWNVSYVAGYVVSQSQGSVTVVAGALNVPLVFTPMTYAVTFTESGLPLGMAWVVGFGSGNALPIQRSTTSTIAFAVTNGSYSYVIGQVAGYTTTTRGSVTVSGAAVGVGVTFAATKVASYPVLFTESGLPAGTSWGVTANGTLVTATAPATVMFSGASALANGVYPFRIGSEAGYTNATTCGGAVTVSGLSVSCGVTFTPVTYAVVFTETGLPSGSFWVVSFNNVVSFAAAGKGITFSAANNTSPGYAFSVGNETTSGNGSYYAPSPLRGTISVNGGSVARSIAFTYVPRAGLAPAAPGARPVPPVPAAGIPSSRPAESIVRP